MVVFEDAIIKSEYRRFAIRGKTAKLRWMIYITFYKTFPRFKHGNIAGDSAESI